FDRDWRFVTSPVVMTVAEINKVREVSKAKDAGPWMTWWERMAVKTVGRRAFKELPLRDLEEAGARIVAGADDEADFETSALTEDEANIAAGLTNVRPHTEEPDDHVDGEKKPRYTNEQAKRLLGIVAELDELDADTPWRDYASEWAQTQ